MPRVVLQEPHSGGQIIEATTGKSPAPLARGPLAEGGGNSEIIRGRCAERRLQASRSLFFQQVFQAAISVTSSSLNLSAVVIA
jgi:hypothetical protein